METFRLWLEKDSQIPRFKRLAFKKVQVHIADVLKKGIHPWERTYVRGALMEKFVEVLNTDEIKLPELAQSSYCGDVSCVTAGYTWQDTSPFEETLQRIKECVYFVDALSYVELLEIAKQRLQQNWSHPIAHALLSRSHPGFDSMRSFLKAKDKNVKLSGYADIERYDLGKILGLEDFQGEDNILISEGISDTNFRSTRFLDKVTEERGLLRLVPEIRDFQVTVTNRKTFPHISVMLMYNCKRDGDSMRFLPELTREQGKRELARAVASEWRVDKGRYCFTTDIPRLATMIEQDGYKIAFPTLDYMEPKKPAISSAQIGSSKATRFSIGKFITDRASGDSIKPLLRAHGVPMTGRKEELVEKLAALSAMLYEQKEAELDDYFSEHRFIRVSPNSSDKGENFPVLEGFDMRNMILAMYIIKHLRGNSILEAGHSNDTFDLLALAQALIKREVSVTGAFLRVE